MNTLALSATLTSNRPIALWLLAVAAMVYAMVLVGGTTRLTHSGLSIVEWRPVTGTIPPLGENAWQAEFGKYRQSPEFQKINRDMTLPEFKQIYWVEFGHRLLGRLTGLVLAVPFAYFLWARRLDRKLILRLGGVVLLFGAQGALGWFMVKSGLENDPAVSHYRLTAHLGLAVVLYGCILWIAFDLLHPRRSAQSMDFGVLNIGSRILLGLVSLQILAGGLVAGLHAGLIYNTWPLMDGAVVPFDLFDTLPWWQIPLENIAAVQFDHRALAYLVAVAAGWLCWYAFRYARGPIDLRHATLWLLAAVLLQVSLGVGTLLLAVPVSLAVVHQGGAILVFTLTLWLCHCTRMNRTDQVLVKA